MLDQKTLVDLQVRLLLAARSVELGESKDLVLAQLASVLDKLAAQIASIEASA